MCTITYRNHVTKNCTMPNINIDNFNWLPFCLCRVKMNMRPVSVRYLHFTRNIAMPLKKGSTDKYEKTKVITMEYSMAFNVSMRLTTILSSSSEVDISLKKASATFSGLGINPSDATCHNINVVISCSTTMMMKV